MNIFDDIMKTKIECFSCEWFEFYGKHRDINIKTTRATFQTSFHGPNSCFLLSKYANSQTTLPHKLWIIYDLSIRLCFRYMKTEMNTEHTYI